MPSDVMPIAKQPAAFPRLMGLRFVLALCVLGYHMLPLLNRLFDLPLIIQLPLSYGWLAVDGFFILSGFIITYHYGHILQTFDWAAYRHFLWQRLARIYPLHLVTLLGLLAIVVAASQSGAALSMENYAMADFVQNLFLVHAWHCPDRLEWNHPAWAISIEWLLYLITPILFKTLLRPRPKWRSLLLAKVSLLLMPLAMTLLPYNTHIAYSVIRGVCAFMSGIFMYQYFFDSTWVVTRTEWLALPVMQTLGEASYALYMVQYAVLVVASHASVMASIADQPLAIRLGYLMIVCLALTLATCVAHRFIEEPARTYLRKRNPFKR